MCVAIVKPIGAKMPSWTTLRDCWLTNEDGAGVAIAHPQNKLVYVSKGFMTYQSLERYLRSLRNVEQCCIAMHFRIATHGGICPQNTHPFPLAKSKDRLHALDLDTPVAVIHNGVFRLPANRMPDDTMSDTAHAVAEMANSSPERWWIKNSPLTSGSKVAVVRAGGNYSLLGDWKCDKGVFYSNLNHTYSFAGYGGWKGGKWTPPAPKDNPPPVQVAGDTVPATTYTPPNHDLGNGSAYPATYRGGCDNPPSWWHGVGGYSGYNRTQGMEDA